MQSVRRPIHTPARYPRFTGRKPCYRLNLAAIMGPSQAPRKRRRPALACAQCRHRKVKCDRNSPCGQCTQRKLDSCTYIDNDQSTLKDQSTFNDQARRGPHFAAAGEVNRRDASLSNQPLGNFADRAAQSGFTERASESYQPHNTLHVSHTTTGSPPNQPGSGPILGTLSKTRIFGHGHWMSTFPLVCNCFFWIGIVLLSLLI